MSYNLKKAEEIHLHKSIYSQDLEACIFHSNMVNAIRLERFRLYPQKFNRIETIRMKKLKEKSNILIDYR